MILPLHKGEGRGEGEQSMSTELKIPQVGESIVEVEIGDWLKKEGDEVAKDEPVVSLESEKATVELPSPDSGRISRILKHKGETAKVGEIIGYMERDGKGSAQTATKPEPRKPKSEQPLPKSMETDKEKLTSPSLASPPKPEAQKNSQTPAKHPERRVMPAAERVLAQNKVRPEDVEATGPGGRILKEDVLRKAEQPQGAPAIAADPSSLSQRTATQDGREEELVPMNRLRRTAAERLVRAQHAAALLTTFNEVDMTDVIALRKQYGESFQQKYNVKLGFMSFFVKACVDALKQFPTLNAEVRDTNVVYRNFFDIGVAVGGGKGLVVPVLRNAERMSFAEIEMTIGDFARRARDNKLKVEELQGGTFTISNGGVYGSLLSTPIVNPPQSGVLGMHAIQERPVAREGAVVIRPMMYLALTYDHRIVDGREAVTFLKRIKEVIENPTRMLMEI